MNRPITILALAAFCGLIAAGRAVLHHDPLLFARAARALEPEAPAAPSTPLPGLLALTPVHAAVPGPPATIVAGFPVSACTRVESVEDGVRVVMITCVPPAAPAFDVGEARGIADEAGAVRAGVPRGAPARPWCWTAPSPSPSRT
jgi:hypothetical protein